MTELTDDERSVLEGVFRKTLDLFKKRNTSEDWSRNLVEGSRGLRTRLQWKHFYAFLANPRGYDEKLVCRETAEAEHHAGPCITPYPPCYEVHEYQNGNETIIHVRNKELYPEECDEKKSED